MIGPMTVLRSRTRISLGRVIYLTFLAFGIIVPGVRGQASKAGQDQAVANLESGAKVFRLDGTKTTDAGVQEFQKTRPNLKISH